MKKGCFISVIIILTLIVAATFYIFKYYNDDIKEFGKQKIVKLAESTIHNELDELPNQQYVDSIKIELTNYLNKIKTEKLDSTIQKIKSIEEIADNFDVILLDKQIDSAEYKFIIRLLNKNDK